MGFAGPLGETISCPEDYSPSVLHPVPRAMGRGMLQLPEAVESLPFRGEDVWNSYELSWLGRNGRPRRSILEMRVGFDSPNLVESKSLKLYLNSLNFKRFDDDQQLLDTIRADLTPVLGAPPAGLALLVADPPLFDAAKWHCVDDYDENDADVASHATGNGNGATHADADVFEPDESLLRCHDAVGDGNGEGGAAVVEERLVSHLLRTLCPVTSQPDWGSVLVHYSGARRLDHAGLARYICSLRRETGFHENCVEKIFCAVHAALKPDALCVTGRFFRRGGIDINPVRYTPGCTFPSAAAGAPQTRVVGQ